MRIEGAETLAFLTEVDADLQRTASMMDHLIQVLADYLRPTPYQDINDNKKVKKRIRFFPPSAKLSVHCSYVRLVL